MPPLTLDSSQQAELLRLAAQTGKPWSLVLSEALASYRAQECSAQPQNGISDESFFDAASKLGLIGCLEGGPTDLSTNPAHMEGFGRRGS